MCQITKFSTTEVEEAMPTSNVKLATPDFPREQKKKRKRLFPHKKLTTNEKIKVTNFIDLTNRLDLYTGLVTLRF